MITFDNLYECFFYIRIIKCTSFNISEWIVPSIITSLPSINLTTVLQITLISNQENNHILLISPLPNLLYPFINIIITNSTRQVKYHHYSNCSSIICFSQTSISFLSSCVPDLGFHSVVFYCYYFWREFHSDGCLRVCWELVNCETVN